MIIQTQMIFSSISFVSGVRHQKVQERLLDLGQDLTLEKAIDKGRQCEFSQSHMTVIRGEEVSRVDVEQKDTKPKTVKHDKNTSSCNKHSTTGAQPRTYKTIKCWKSGKTHRTGKCPARNQITGSKSAKRDLVK